MDKITAEDAESAENPNMNNSVALCALGGEF